MYLEYENYLLNIRNALIQCGIEFEEGISQDTSDYFNLYKLGIKLSDILVFYKVLAVSGSDNMLNGFFLPLNETYKDRMRGICYNEFVTSVLPDYKSLVGAEDDDFIDFSDDLHDEVYEDDCEYNDFNGYSSSGVDFDEDTSEGTNSSVEYVRNGIYLDEDISSDIESYGGSYNEDFDDYSGDESSYNDYDEEYEEYDETSYDEESSYDEEETPYDEYDEEESLYSSFEEDESDYESFVDDEFEETPYDEYDDEEESPYYDGDDEFEEESPYYDEDEEFEESPYDDYDDEESPYDSVFDEEDDESDYGLDYEESSYEDYEDSDDVSHTNHQNSVAQPVKTQPVKRFSKDSDMGEDIQDITNAILTKVKRGAINFLNRKE